MVVIIIALYFIVMNYVRFTIGTCAPPPNYDLKYATVEQSKSLHNQKVPTVWNLKFIIQYTEHFNKLQDSELIKKKIIVPATKFWENSLKVYIISKERFYVQRYCENNYYMELNGTKFCQRRQCRQIEKCHGADIPSEYLSACYENFRGQLTERYPKGKGLSRNNYFLIVDSQTKGSCLSPNTNAYAGACFMDPESDRPLVGYVNFCPSKTKLEYPRNRSLWSTARHEIAHTLGFAKQHFAFMRDKNGDPRTFRDQKTGKPLNKDIYGIYIPSTNTIKEIKRTWKSAVGTYFKTFSSFVTEAILREAKEHFGCKWLDGVDLEDEGGPGSKGSHLKGRLFSTELMASATEVDSFASKVTFAYFEDSGWYKVNYEKSEKWIYGKNLGCTFTMQSCYAYASVKRMKQENILPFCDQPNIVMCRDDYSYGICAIGMYTDPLLPEDQFFDNKSFAGDKSDHYGGVEKFKNFCPTVTYLSQLGSLKVTSFCTHDENNKIAVTGQNDYLQSFGKSAICVKHMGTWTYQDGRYTYYLDPLITGTCHKYICNEKKLLTIDFRGSRVQCPRNGGTRKFSIIHDSKRHNGTIICPQADKFC